jgi:hypothetical protein
MAKLRETPAQELYPHLPSANKPSPPSGAERRETVADAMWPHLAPKPPRPKVWTDRDSLLRHLRAANASGRKER